MKENKGYPYKAGRKIHSHRTDSNLPSVLDEDMRPINTDTRKLEERSKPVTPSKSRLDQEVKKKWV